MSGDVSLSITLSVEEYRVVAELLDAEQVGEVSVRGYLQSCAKDLAREALSVA